MSKKTELELLLEAKTACNELPSFIQKQAGPVLVPIVGLLEVLLVEKVEREARRTAALAHLDSIGNGLREKTALGIYLTGGA